MENALIIINKRTNIPKELIIGYDKYPKSGFIDIFACTCIATIPIAAIARNPFKD
jgi:hypothetical protein